MQKEVANAMDLKQLSDTGSVKINPPVGSRDYLKLV